MKVLTVKSEFRPHMTSFNLLVGDHPNPSTLCCLRIDKHTSPFSLMFGCHSLVKHLTIGG